MTCRSFSYHSADRGSQKYSLSLPLIFKSVMLSLVLKSVSIIRSLKTLECVALITAVRDVQNLQLVLRNTVGIYGCRLVSRRNKKSEYGAATEIRWFCLGNKNMVLECKVVQNKTYLGVEWYGLQLYINKRKK